MKYDIQPLREQDVNDIVKWRYEPPYDLYNLSYLDIPFLLDPKNRYFAVHGESGKLIGYCCFGEEARVPGGDYQQIEPVVLDIGVGLHPGQVGRGLGISFVDELLQFGVDEFIPEKLRVTVAAFNQRSLRTFLKHGFKETQRFKRKRDDMIFIQLERMAG